jgi:dihydrofolate reductase
MRKLIAGMQSSLDGKIGRPDGFADWVDAWSDHYEVMPRVDACVLGAGMYPGYEQYWTAIRHAPTGILPMTGKLATAAEVEYARFTERTPHYVLSSTLSSATWPSTRFLSSVAEVADLKQQPGRDIYLVGGAQLVATLLDAGLVDELELAVHPLLVGPGRALFEATRVRRELALRRVRELPGGIVGLSYALA